MGSRAKRAAVPYASPPPPPRVDDTLSGNIDFRTTELLKCRPDYRTPRKCGSHRRVVVISPATTLWGKVGEEH